MLPTNLSYLFSQLTWQDSSVILALYRNSHNKGEWGRRKLTSQNNVLEMEKASWEGWFFMKKQNDKTKELSRYYTLLSFIKLKQELCIKVYFLGDGHSLTFRYRISEILLPSPSVCSWSHESLPMASLPIKLSSFRPLTDNTLYSLVRKTTKKYQRLGGFINSNAFVHVSGD